MKSKRESTTGQQNASGNASYQDNDHDNDNDPHDDDADEESWWVHLLFKTLEVLKKTELRTRR